MIVVDTNVVAGFVLLGHSFEAAKSLYGRDPEWSAPVLWRSEFRNVLATQVRRGRYGLEAAVALMRRAEGLLAGREFSAPSPIVLELAAESGCTAYDCEFVAVAMELGVRLVTQDAQVLKAFPKVAVDLR